MDALEHVVATGFDAIYSQVAIVDVDGVIVYTNDAWDAFGESNGAVGDVAGPGDSYLGVTERGQDPSADDALDGLEGVVTGDEETGGVEYPCQKRWFMMRASAYDVDGERYAIVIHVDITNRKLAELQRQSAQNSSNSSPGCSVTTSATPSPSRRGDSRTAIPTSSRTSSNGWPTSSTTHSSWRRERTT